MAMASSPAPLQVRLLTAADVPAAARLYHQAYAHSGEGGWDEVTAAAIITDLLRLFPDQCFAAERDGALHGIILCSSIAGARATVEELAVAPDVQRQGIGSALLDHVVAFYRGRGLPFVELVANRAAPAYAFYRRRGFRENEGYRLLGRELRGPGERPPAPGATPDGSPGSPRTRGTSDPPG